jgi:hypothetical protein
LVNTSSSSSNHAGNSNIVIDSAESSDVPSRVLKDAFRLLDLIKVSLRHGLSKDFMRSFRDALFVVDSEDKQRVEAYLIFIGTNWEYSPIS